MSNDDIPINWSPESDDDYEMARAELRRRFAAWSAERAIAVGGDGPEAPLHYKWSLIDGHLTRWTRHDLNEMYLEICPAKVIAEEEELGEILDEARTLITFLADTDLLDPKSDPPDVLIDHLTRIESRFRAHMTDVSRYSFGKRLAIAASAEGVQPDDTPALEAFMARFNSRPRAEREAILGPLPGVSRPMATGRFTPPGTRATVPSNKKRKRRR